MNWDFVGRRPLPVRDYVVSIKVGDEIINIEVKNEFSEFFLANTKAFLIV